VPSSAPGNFAQLASAYRNKHGVSKEELKRAIAHVSVKSHANGTKNPKAHLQKAITEEMCLNAPMIAEPLGLLHDRNDVGELGRLLPLRVRARQQREAGSDDAELHPAGCDARTRSIAVTRAGT